MPKNFWDFAPPCLGKRVRMFKHKYMVFVVVNGHSTIVQGQVHTVLNSQMVELCSSPDFCLSSPNLLFSILFYDSGVGPFLPVALPLGS